MELGGVIGVYPLRLVSNRVHVRGVVEVGPGVDFPEGQHHDTLRDREGRLLGGVQPRGPRGVRAGDDVGDRDVRLHLWLARLVRLGFAEG